MAGALLYAAIVLALLISAAGSAGMVILLIGMSRAEATTKQITEMRKEGGLVTCCLCDRPPPNGERLFAGACSVCLLTPPMPTRPRTIVLSPKELQDLRDGLRHSNSEGG